VGPFSQPIMVRTILTRYLITYTYCVHQISPTSVGRIMYLSTVHTYQPASSHYDALYYTRIYSKPRFLSYQSWPQGISGEGVTLSLLWLNGDARIAVYG
jgi:hypothetical protein